ncbi:MAG: hypothetical protein II998_06400 [Clostridia bacterium]|nr:hypothetical protein [Clostridia bacterium]
MPDKREIFIVEMDNGKNLKAEIINYGGIIKSLWVKNKDGEFIDVVLGRNTAEEYFSNDGYFGAAVGRFANRIGDSKFELNGTEYFLDANNGKNSLHGGNKGFRKAATVKGDLCGIVMEMYTDKPAVQLYTGNSIKEDRMCKNGHFYSKHGALCLETQFYPNSTSFSHFTSPVLKMGEKYDFTTEYRFS